VSSGVSPLGSLTRPDWPSLAETSTLCELSRASSAAGQPEIWPLGPVASTLTVPWVESESLPSWSVALPE
jgi:hypothetical protein